MHNVFVNTYLFIYCNLNMFRCLRIIIREGPRRHYLYRMLRDSSFGTRLAARWTVRESRPGGGQIFRTHQDRLWIQPASCKMGTWSLALGQSSRNVALTDLLHLVLRLKSSAVPLLTLSAFMTCSRVNCNLHCLYISVCLSVCPYIHRPLANSERIFAYLISLLESFYITFSN